MKQRAELTFKENLKHGRHGWLRLTPAYSIQVVEEVLRSTPDVSRVLDPFSGSGTTGLVCAERGVACDLLEINPFLAWLAKVKTSNYSSSDVEAALALARDACEAVPRHLRRGNLWIPPLKNVERWWTEHRLAVLGALAHHMKSEAPVESRGKALDLVHVAFCRLLIQWSAAAFNHQSLSFREHQPSLYEDETEVILDDFKKKAGEVARGAAVSLRTPPRVFLGDARTVPQHVPGPVDLVVTSPPYPNRMSYIREVRPYMYWLEFLKDGRQAGELDWAAVGGTWGLATSRLSEWKPSTSSARIARLDEAVDQISSRSVILGNYVARYFEDIASHLGSLAHVLAKGARVYYVVGNSKFYETMVDVEEIYAEMLRALGFENVTVTPLRKRNSKKELVEYAVTGTWHHEPKR